MRAGELLYGNLDAKLGEAIGGNGKVKRHSYDCLWREDNVGMHFLLK